MPSSVQSRLPSVTSSLIAAVRVSRASSGQAGDLLTVKEFLKY